MPVNNVYQVTIWLSVTDAHALKCAATELAEAMETPDGMCPVASGITCLCFWTLVHYLALRSITVVNCPKQSDRSS